MRSDESDAVRLARAWTSRARELRAIADTLTDPDARKGMLRAALAYERMAEEMQRSSPLGVT